MSIRMQYDAPAFNARRGHRIMCLSLENCRPRYFNSFQMMGTRHFEMKSSGSGQTMNAPIFQHRFGRIKSSSFMKK